MAHKHRAASIELRGKPDSVYVYCECGHVEAFGIWFHMPPLGWRKKGFKSLMKAIAAFLDSSK